MPLGLFTGLPAGQIEAILLHELAHIRQIEGLGDNLYLTFIDRTGDGDYRAPANAQ
jgi:beta-lactamase regulating signal transducer with metallopeptidase domain